MTMTYAYITYNVSLSMIDVSKKEFLKHLRAAVKNIKIPTEIH